jgi:hypothetical protein
MPVPPAPTEQFPGIQSLDDAGLTDLATLGDGLDQPFDDVPRFDPTADPEVDVNARLSSDRQLLRTPRRRLCIDYRPNPDALTHLKVLPREGESLHGVICGKYAMWDLVPALIERTGRKIADLHIATLSYGKQNATELLSLIDDGQVKRCSLIVSYYFKAQNRPLYDTLVPPLRERGHRVLAMRNHAKLLLVKLVGGGSFVVEGSANLRSCKNVEQFVLTRCRRLYRFHREWLERELLSRCVSGGHGDEDE